ncbi:MAG: SgcJ/EcaC family oxidoreductase [Chthoniobacter sp.]|nr:SgcJ/EcaC family oxidoreductase [Chthoniobacter sp.]
MKQLLILSLITVSAGAFAADNEPPKLVPVPKPPVQVATPASIPPEQKEIEKGNEEYVAAFQKGDHKTLAAFYTEDADQTDGEGNVVVSGRAAIEKQLKEYFDENKGAEVELNIDSVRPLAPEVVLEQGEAVVTRATGDSSKTNYLAIHVKRGGKWLTAHLTESESQATPSPYSHLQELEWMVGTWKDNTSEAEVHTTCDWAKNKTFLTRSFSAVSKDRGELEGTEVMGWDPIKGHIRAWIFDSEGGFSEAIWTRDGNRWLVQSVTTLPDGRKASALNTITHVNDDKYTWESSNRALDGAVRPNIDKIEIDRVKSKH